MELFAECRSLEAAAGAVGAKPWCRGCDLCVVGLSEPGLEDFLGDCFTDGEATVCDIALCCYEFDLLGGRGA